MTRYHPDVLAEGLDVVFCGINPAVSAVRDGHNFSSPSNRFWAVLHLAGFTDSRIRPEDESRLLRFGCGITAVVPRPTRRSSQVSVHEFRHARTAFEAKIRRWRPQVTAFLGKRALTAMVGAADVSWGRQPNTFAETVAWVLPNPSGLNRRFTLDALVCAYIELRRAVADTAAQRLRRQRPTDQPRILRGGTSPMRLHSHHTYRAQAYRRSTTMGQAEKAARFAELHVTDKPLLLFNAWDAGSAKAILGAGVTAIATSSWSIAEAQGYRDGEDIPIALAEQVIARIAATVDAPVSADFEGGYSGDNGELADNAARLIGHGVVGINFEDRVVKGAGLYDVDRQAGRIAAIRAAADQKEVDLFINARTDLFLGQGREPAEAVSEALVRSKAYAAAGASGFFIPGLQDEALIGEICEASELPVNVMVMDGVPSVERLTELGVARISWGPIPYINAMAALQRDAATVLS